MIRQTVIALVMFSLLMSLQTSCRHKDILCPGNEPHTLTVKFMWDKAPEAAPDGMTLYFFPAGEGTRIWRFDIAGREGGNVEIPQGEYRFLAVNNDLPGVMFSGEDAYGNFTANTRKNQETGLMRPTGMLYGGTVDHVEITPCGIIYTTPEGTMKECSQGLLRCHPDSLSCVYNVIFRRCEGAENIRTASACIKGVASALRVAYDTPGGEPVATAFALDSRKLPDGDALSGCTTVLGTDTGHSPSVTLTLNVERTDGKHIAKSFDVTDQVVNSINPHNVFIIITGVEIPAGDTPDTPGGDVGIDVGVDGWQTIEIDIGTALP